VILPSANAVFAQDRRGAGWQAREDRGHHRCNGYTAPTPPSTPASRRGGSFWGGRSEFVAPRYGRHEGGPAWTTCSLNNRPGEFHGTERCNRYPAPQIRVGVTVTPVIIDAKPDVPARALPGSWHAGSPTGVTVTPVITGARPGVTPRALPASWHEGGPSGVTVTPVITGAGHDTPHPTPLIARWWRGLSGVPATRPVGAKDLRRTHHNNWSWTYQPQTELATSSWRSASGVTTRPLPLKLGRSAPLHLSVACGVTVTPVITGAWLDVRARALSGAWCRCSPSGVTVTPHIPCSPAPDASPLHRLEGWLRHMRVDCSCDVTVTPQPEQWRRTASEVRLPHRGNRYTAFAPQGIRAPIAPHGGVTVTPRPIFKSNCPKEEYEVSTSLSIPMPMCSPRAASALTEKNPS